MRFRLMFGMLAANTHLRGDAPEHRRAAHAMRLRRVSYACPSLCCCRNGMPRLRFKQHRNGITSFAAQAMESTHQQPSHPGSAPYLPIPQI